MIKGEKLNSKEVFNYLFESFNQKNVKYAIIHSYQNLPERFDSDIDTAIDVPHIKDAILFLDNTLQGTGWRVIQYWRHENYAADCVISNDKEFLQVDFCTHYERNGRVVMPVEELLEDRRQYKNFYIPNAVVEFTYILIKKVLKKNFSDGSKEQLTALLANMSEDEVTKAKKGLQRFFSADHVYSFMSAISRLDYDSIDLKAAHEELQKKTSDFKSNLQYKFFDSKRRVERIVHPTGLFIVLLGVDGAGKTTIAEELKKEYLHAFRRIEHYHSRVRVLNDISQMKPGVTPVDASDPHRKKHRSGKIVSAGKLIYYLIDFIIGNVKITKSKIKSTLVIIERYYYDYTIDKVRYNLNLPDGFIKFFGHLVKKPDAIFILTGDSQILLDRKNEITLQDIEEQKERLSKEFEGDSKAVFIDTTQHTVEECVEQMMGCCNKIMRERRKWK